MLSSQSKALAGVSKSKAKTAGKAKKQDTGQQAAKRTARNKRKAADDDYEYDQEAEAEVSLWQTTTIANFPLASRTVSSRVLTYGLTCCQSIGHLQQHASYQNQMLLF